MKISIVFIALFTMLLTGCLEIPSQETLQANDGVRLIDRCPPVIPVSNQPQKGLPATFSMTVWNLHKFQRAGWQKALSNQTKRSQLLLLQESMARPAFFQLLRQANLQWQQIQAFKLEDEATGVLNASAVAAIYNCSQRELEPVSRIPKSALLSLYPLTGSASPLMVINVHGINFELGMAAYQRQMNKLFRLAEHYPGPVVLSGDFASWGKRRQAYLQNLAQQAKFAEVLPQPDQRSRFVSTPVDHLFYRGLQLLRTDVQDTNASDHNPLWAEFSVLQIPIK